MISHLNKKHEVTVASLVRTKQEEREGAGLGAYCNKYIFHRITKPMAVYRMIIRLPTVVPSSMGYFYSPNLAKKIKKELESQNYDLLFVHCSSVAQYVENVTGIPKILDFGDMDSQKWFDYSKIRAFPLSAGYWLEAQKIQKAEKILAEKFDYCTCTTRAEKDTLDSYGCQTPTSWFPNGVDYEYFTPKEDPYDPDLISFIGRMDYFPNQECMFDFCKNVLPLIRKRRPNVRLSIIGADPTPEVKALEKIGGVEVTGSVPDVRPYVTRSAVNVAPLNIARGTQNKILEAMAMGVPVVSSRNAAGGIDAIQDEHFLVATTYHEYADKILEILDNPIERDRLSRAGRKRVMSNHDWNNSMLRLDEIIANCLN